MAAQSVPPSPDWTATRFRCHRRSMVPGTTTIDCNDLRRHGHIPQSAAGLVSEVRGLSPETYASTGCPDQDMSKMDILLKISSRY